MSMFYKLKLLLKKPIKINRFINLRKTSSFLVRSGTEQKESLIIKKFTEINEAYVRVIGLDEVKRFQDKVIVIQDKLEKTQVIRRDVGKELNDVRKHLNRLQEQLHKVNRYEERQKFIDLTSEETEVIKKERDLSLKFDEYDKMEREIFTALCNAVRDSHEKERAQSEYTKYFSIILSIIGTFVGAVLSMLINTVRTKELITGIEKNFDSKLTRTNNDLINIDVKVDNANIKLTKLLEIVNQSLQADILKETITETFKIDSETQTLHDPSTSPDSSTSVIDSSTSVIDSSTVSVHDSSNNTLPLINLDESIQEDESKIFNNLDDDNKTVSINEDVSDKHMTAAAFTLIGVIFVLRVIFGY